MDKQIGDARQALDEIASFAKMLDAGRMSKCEFQQHAMISLNLIHGLIMLGIVQKASVMDRCCEVKGTAGAICKSIEDRA